MARNGAGTYSLPAGNPVTTGTTISSTWANNTLNDISSALTASIANDGQTTPVANLTMGGYIHTNVGNATVRTNYSAAGQVQDGTLTYLTGISGTDTITAIAPISMNAYASGQTFRFIAAGANTTTSVTLNINSIGAKAITKNGSTALAIGDIPSGSIVMVTYDGTQFQLQAGIVGVTSFSAGTTGLTPSTATKGAITLAGTLATANGGTNLTSFTSGGAVYATSTSALTTGTLPIASGGTGITSVGSAGNVLFTTDGSTWSSTAKIVRPTAVNSTSGTSIDFTGIPSWVKRITMILGGVSTNGTSPTIIQLGSSTITTSGYAGACASGSNASNPSVIQPTNGFQIIAEASGLATYVRQGLVTITNISANLWVASGTGSESATGRFWTTSGTISLGGVLDRIRLTTSGGTDTFDAGTVNILYE